MGTLIKKRVRKRFQFSVSKDLPIGVTGASIKDFLESEEKRGATVVGVHPEDIYNGRSCYNFEELVAYVYDSYRLGEESERILFVKVDQKMWIGRTVDELILKYGRRLGIPREVVLKDIVKMGDNSQKEAERLKKKDEISRRYSKSA